MRNKYQFQCSQCGYNSPKWLGRCPNCGAWGSLDQITITAKTKSAVPANPATSAQRITEIDPDLAVSKSTGIQELDRVLGGGYISGSVILLAGEPGVGKSTLLLTLAGAIAPRSQVLYITGEESAGQVRLRAERTKTTHENIFLVAETDIDVILGQAEDVKPEVMIIDSVQTLTTSQTEGSAGGVNQVKAITNALSSFAKASNTTVFIVGHVTKDGLIAGPRTLEHMVDVVLHFEGDKNSTLRMIRGIKNRYGSVDEVGCFEQCEEGIIPVADPTALFMHDSSLQIPGSAITVTMDGKRPLVAEVQTLIVPSTSPAPRRAVSGLDTARLAMILAVLERRCKIKVTNSEVYAATVGGMKIIEPAADLAIALSAASAVLDRALPAGLVVIGEVGLAGEVRIIRGLERRLAEAARMGFTSAIVPDNGLNVKTESQMKIYAVKQVSEAIKIITERS